MSLISEQVLQRPTFKCIVLSDSMAKHVSGIRGTKIVAFPGINISRLSSKISQGMICFDCSYIIVHVGTNDISGHLTEDEIVALFNELITLIRSKCCGRILMSSILPRPIDFERNGNKVKNVNNKLAALCKSRNVTFLRSFKPFLKCGFPRREFFAVRDGGLHLNLEGIRRLREFFVNTVAHLT